MVNVEIGREMTYLWLINTTWGSINLTSTCRMRSTPEKGSERVRVVLEDRRCGFTSAEA